MKATKDNSTFIIGGLIISKDYQFTIERLKEFKPLFKPNKYNEIESLYYENKSIKENWNKLANDDNYIIRLAVALNSKCLDKLYNDIDFDVRSAVALNGYKLDVLINDKHPAVRTAVASRKYKLNVLINDASPMVRNEVVNQGYGLDKLVNDYNFKISLNARRKVTELAKYN